MQQCTRRATVEPGIPNNAEVDTVQDHFNIQKDHISFTTGSTTLLIQSVVGAVSMKVTNFLSMSLSVTQSYSTSLSMSLLSTFIKVS